MDLDPIKLHLDLLRLPLDPLKLPSLSPISLVKLPSLSPISLLKLLSVKIPSPNQPSLSSLSLPPAKPHSPRPILLPSSPPNHSLLSLAHLELQSPLPLPSLQTKSPSPPPKNCTLSCNCSKFLMPSTAKVPSTNSNTSFTTLFPHRTFPNTKNLQTLMS